MHNNPKVMYLNPTRLPHAATFGPSTRKYLTQCRLWYFPPPEAIVRMAVYCNEHGRPTEHPYFSLDKLL